MLIILALVALILMVIGIWTIGIDSIKTGGKQEEIGYKILWLGTVLGIFSLFLCVFYKG